MYKRIVIIGSGGHGKVVADLAMKTGYTDISFIDDRATDECLGRPIVGKIENIYDFNDGNTGFIVAIGNNSIRKRIVETHDVPWVSLIHPSAQIGYGVTIGKGTVIMPCAVINTCASVGDHCIVNSGAIVEHENVIEDFAHISPNVALGGAVHIGKSCHVGIGASVKNNIRICDNTVIGAGAVVVRNINESGTYIGIPAKIGGVNSNYLHVCTSDRRCAA